MNILLTFEKMNTVCGKSQSKRVGGEGCKYECDDIKDRDETKTVVVCVHFPLVANVPHCARIYISQNHNELCIWIFRL